MFKKSTILINLLFVTLTLLFIFPLIPHFGSSIPYTHAPVLGFEQVKDFQGDHYQYLYHLALLGKALSGKIPFFDIGYQFDTPYKPRLSTRYFPPQGILFFLFSFLGYATAYNILIVLSFLVSLISTYCYLKEIKLSMLGAIAGAIIYTFFPYRLASLFGGHPAGMMVAYIPLFFFFLERGLCTRNRKVLISAGFTLSLFSVSEPHYFYFLSLLLPFYLLYMLLRENISTLTLPNIYPLFKKANSQEKTYFLNGLLPCLVFFIFYTSRRGNINPLAIVLSATIGFVCFLLLVLLSYLFYQKLTPTTNTEQIRSTMFKRLQLLNVLYLYIIQAFIEIKGLAILLTTMTLLIYFISLCFLITKKEWNIFTTNSQKLLFSYTQKTATFLKFSYPFLIILSLALISVMAMKHGNISGSSIAKGRSIYEVGLFSPNLADILKPFNHNSATYLYPGFIALIIALFHLIKTIITIIKRKTLNKLDISVLFFSGLFIFSLLLAFGQNINTPPIFILCRKIIPFFHFIRSPIKVIILTALSLSILIAFALNSLKNKKFLIYTVIILLTAEYYMLSKIGTTTVTINNKVLTTLKTNSKHTKIAYIPIWPGDSSWSSLYQLYCLLTDTPMINGYQPTVPAKYISDIFHPLYGLNFGQITYSEWKKLKELGVTHLVFHKEAFPPKVSPFPQSFTNLNLFKNNFLEFVSNDDPLYLYKLKDFSDEEALRVPSIKKIPFPFGFTAEGQWFKPLTENAIIYKNTNHSSNGGILLTGQNNTIAYNKYLPSNNYNGFIAFNIETTNIIELSLSIIDKNNNEKQLTNQIFEPTTKSLYLPFSFALNEAGRTTLKINKTGEGKVFIDYLHFNIDSEKKSPLIISPETGIFTGRIVKENSQPVIFIDDAEYKAGPAFLGPNRLYQKGKYTVSFNLKSIPNQQEKSNKNQLIQLEVINSYGSKIFTNRFLAPEEFNDDWQTFSLPFSLEQDEILNFHVHFPGYGKLWVGKIIIQKK